MSGDGNPKVYIFVWTRASDAGFTYTEIGCFEADMLNAFTSHGDKITIAYENLVTVFQNNNVGLELSSQISKF